MSKFLSHCRKAAATTRRSSPSPAHWWTPATRSRRAGRPGPAYRGRVRGDPLSPVERGARPHHLRGRRGLRARLGAAHPARQVQALPRAHGVRAFTTRDVAVQIERDRPDAVVATAIGFGAQAGAEAGRRAGRPAAHHQLPDRRHRAACPTEAASRRPAQRPRPSPPIDARPRGPEALEPRARPRSTRPARAVGLAPVDHPFEQFDRAARFLVLTSRASIFPVEAAARQRALRGPAPGRPRVGGRVVAAARGRPTGARGLQLDLHGTGGPAAANRGRPRLPVRRPHHPGPRTVESPELTRRRT